MATSCQTLVDRVRRFMRDWPDEDALTASASSSATSLTVATDATTRYGTGWYLEVDSEVVRTTAVAATTLTVQRARRGTTAATHASSATILVRPHFFQNEIVDALNLALESSFPAFYRPVIDETLTTTAGTYEYEVPDMPSDTTMKIPYISKLFVQETGDTAFRETRAWEIQRGDEPKIKFRREPVIGTLRVHGYGPFPALTLAGSLHDLFPRQGEGLLVEFAASWLMASGEAGRVRVDRGATDQREQANVAGSSMRASQALFNRFLQRRSDAAMPPLPRHVKSVV